MNVSTPRAEMLFFAPLDELPEQPSPSGGQAVRIGSKRRALELSPKADLVPVLMELRSWAVGTERKKPRRVCDEAYAVPIF